MANAAAPGSRPTRTARSTPRPCKRARRAPWVSPPIPIPPSGGASNCAVIHLHRRWPRCSVAAVDGGSKTGAGRVIRGGSWNDNARNCRCAYRNQNTPDNRNENLGFRCARAQRRTGRSEPEQIPLPGGGLPSPQPKGPRRVGSGERMPREGSPVGRLPETANPCLSHLSSMLPGTR